MVSLLMLGLRFGAGVWCSGSGSGLGLAFGAEAQFRNQVRDENSDRDGDGVHLRDWDRICISVISGSVLLNIELIVSSIMSADITFDLSTLPRGCIDRLRSRSSRYLFYD